MAAPLQTLAYLLPTLSRAVQHAEAEFEALQKEGQAYSAGALQALVVAPSRELAMQIVRVAQELLPPAAKHTVQQCIGGANPHRQVRSWRVSPHSVPPHAGTLRSHLAGASQMVCVLCGCCAAGSCRLHPAVC